MQNRDSKGRFMKKVEIVQSVPLFKVSADKIYTGLSKHTFIGIMSESDYKIYQQKTGIIVVAEHLT